MNSNINFPLFDILYKESKSIIPKVNEKLECVDNIKNLDTDGKNKIYIIIKMYSENIDKITEENMPYDGQKILKKNGEDSVKNDTELYDILFNINDFPNKLKNMIIIFVKKHLEKMKNDKEIYNINNIYEK